MSKHSLILNFDGMPGTDIVRDIIPEMVEMSRRLNCKVQVKVNGKLLLCRPETDVKDFQDAWRTSTGKVVVA